MHSTRQEGATLPRRTLYSPQRCLDGERAASTSLASRRYSMASGRGYLPCVGVARIQCHSGPGQAATVACPGCSGAAKIPAQISASVHWASILYCRPLVGRSPASRGRMKVELLRTMGLLTPRNDDDDDAQRPSHLRVPRSTTQERSGSWNRHGTARSPVQEPVCYPAPTRTGPYPAWSTGAAPENPQITRSTRFRHDWRGFRGARSRRSVGVRTRDSVHELEPWRNRTQTWPTRPLHPLPRRLGALP